MPVLDKEDSLHKTKAKKKKRKETKTDDDINLSELSNNDTYESACNIIKSLAGSETITARLGKTGSGNGTLVLEDIEFPLDYESQMSLRRELAESRDPSPFTALPIDAWETSGPAIYPEPIREPADSGTLKKLNKKWEKLEKNIQKGGGK